MSQRIALTYPHALGVPGGGTVHCHRLALALADAGAEVILVPVESVAMSVAPRRRPDPEMRRGPFLEPLERAGIDIRPVRQNPLAWWFDGLGVRRALLDLDAERRLDAVLGWWGELAFAVAPLRRRGVFSAVLAAAPYSLWWERPYGRPRWLHRLADEWVVARTARRVDRVFANSRHIAAQVTSLLGVDGSKIDVVPPPLDERFAAIERQRSDRIERLLYFGRLRPKKGVLDLVEALGRLRDARWQLRIAGAGEPDTVRRQIAAAGIEERVEVLGAVDPSAIRELLGWAELVVLPSYEESFGLAVAEAQLAGVAVIAYDIGAVREIHRDGETGWLVPVGRTDRLAETIRRALSDSEEVRRRGRRARELALEELLTLDPARRILQRIATDRASAGATSEG